MRTAHVHVALRYVHPVDLEVATLLGLTSASLTTCSMSDVDDMYDLHDDDSFSNENSGDRPMSGQDYQSEYHHEQESSGFISPSQTPSTTETSTSLSSSDSQKKSGRHCYIHEYDC